MTFNERVQIYNDEKVKIKKRQGGCVFVSYEKSLEGSMSEADANELAGLWTDGDFADARLYAIKKVLKEDMSRKEAEDDPRYIKAHRKTRLLWWLVYKKEVETDYLKLRTPAQRKKKLAKAARKIKEYGG
jgi:hypothetical protein